MDLGGGPPLRLRRLPRDLGYRPRPDGGTEADGGRYRRRVGRRWALMEHDRHRGPSRAALGRGGREPLRLEAPSGAQALGLRGDRAPDRRPARPAARPAGSNGRGGPGVARGPSGAGGQGWGAVLATRVDPAEYRPRLREDIEVKTFRLRWGNDYSMIANPTDLLHYQVRPEDAELLPLMDGTRTVKDIVVGRLQESGGLSVDGVADLVRQLRVGNFLP